VVMTTEQLDERARQRAVGERLHTFKLAGEPLYLVRSRGTEPGAMHQVHVDRAGAVDDCTCKGWEYRRVCTHAAAVTRRLEREGHSRRSNPARDNAA